MPTLKRIISFFSPVYIIPPIKTPVISLTSDSFTVNGKVIYFNEIQSVFFTDFYPTVNESAPPVGFPRWFYVLLTNDEVISFPANRSELAAAFNNHLEIGEGIYSNFFGEVFRWKKIGEQYTLVNFSDFRSYYFMESLAKKQISTKFIWYAIAGFVVLLISVFAATIYLGLN